MRTRSAWRWAAATGVLYALIGTLFVLASFDESLLAFLNAALVPDRAPATASVRMYAAVMGAVVVGLGVMLARVAACAMRGPTAIALALRDGLLVWFVVDTTASLLHGSWQNACLNAVSLAVALPPVVIAARGHAARGR